MGLLCEITKTRVRRVEQRACNSPHNISVSVTHLTHFNVVISIQESETQFLQSLGQILGKLVF
jgi:hypothetical protein